MAEGKRPASSRRGSSTNTGTTRSASRCAAVRAGWSCTRRSRRNQAIAVSIAPGTARRRSGLTAVRRYALAMALVRDFPLFPLGLVALPSELIPLHIFEERYKTMMARVLEEEGEFGIVWVADDGLRPIGCACEIAEVLERMEDGRLNLVARGTRAFRIEARQEELAYPAGTIEFLDDRTEEPDPAAADEAHAIYAELVAQATDRTPDAAEIDADVRLPDGRDGRVRPGGEAGPARPALGDRPAAARHAPVPGRDQAAGLRRAGPGAGALERQGPLRRLSTGARRVACPLAAAGLDNIVCQCFPGGMLDVEVIEDPGAAVVALDPVRARLLAALAEPGSAAALAQRVSLPRQKVNYHLRALEAHGLVRLVEERAWGGITERVLVATAASYIVSPAALGAAANDPARSSDRLSARYLIALAGRVVREVGELARRAEREDKRLATLAVDAEIRFRSPADRAAFTRRARRGGRVARRPLPRPGGARRPPAPARRRRPSPSTHPEPEEPA